jgi:hypothetical protein
MIYSILAGNIIRFFLTFRDADDALADPTTVTCEVGTTALDALGLSVIHDSTGKYHADWDTTGLLAGTYYAKAVATGAIIAAREIPVRVRGSHLG